MTSDWHGKTKSPGSKIKVGYEEVFGKTRMTRGSMAFPLIVADADVFFQQNDICNCGMAVVAHFLEFYVVKSIVTTPTKAMHSKSHPTKAP